MKVTRRSTSAFTLIEMAIVILIFGLMTGLILTLRPIMPPDTCLATTQAQLVDIRAAIEQYAVTHNRYPAPSPRNNNVGQEDTTGTTLDVIPNSGNALLFGSLPYATLGLANGYSADCWGNQFTYVVTQSLTSSDIHTGFPNAANLGGIMVKANATNSLANNAAYAVISHGATGRETNNGAVSKSYTGTVHQWCTGTSTLDHSNCNLGPVFYSATYNNGPNAGANFFDDVMFYALKKSASCNESSYVVTWKNHCSATVPGLIYNGDVRKDIASTAAGYGGLTDVKCVNGTLEPVAAAPTPTCYAASCSGMSVTWTGPSTASCSGMLPTTNNGDTATANSVSPHSSSVTATCTEGAWGPTTGSCYDDGVCGSANGGQFATAPTSNLCSTGAASAVTQDASPYATSYHWTCASPNGGASANCLARAVDCPAQTLTYQSCSAPFAVTSGGSYTMHTPTSPAGYTGQIIYQCSTAGVWSAADPASSCTAP